MNNKWTSKLADLSETDKNWLASAIDFEGCIDISEFYPQRRQYGEFRTRISVGVTDKVLVDRIVELTNGLGSIYHRIRMNGHYKDVWEWSVSALQAEAFLDAISPYVIAKQKQMDLFKKFISTKSQIRPCPNRHLPDDIIRERHKLIAELRSLKKGGNNE